jgi:hypothetical protein
VGLGVLPCILYINLKNLDWPTQNILPNGFAITPKPHAIFITGIADFAQVAWLQDWVMDGCEVTIEMADDVVGELPIWVNRVSLLYTYNCHPRLDRESKRHKFEITTSKCAKSESPWIPDQVGDDKVIVNIDYTIDNRLSWPTHHIALQKLLPHIQHLSIYGLQRHDIKQQLKAWLAAQGWGFYDAFHAKPLVEQPCRFLVDSYNLQMPLLGVGAGAYSRWPVDGQWFERKLNHQGKGVWQKLTPC